MKLARWKTAPRKPVRLHVTTDGIKTACGALISETATLTRDTDEWYLHTNCYNCAYRLWPQHGPPGYLRPHNGKDFPPRKRRAILGRRAEGQSLREIARGVGVSLAVVHGEVKAAESNPEPQ